MPRRRALPATRDAALTACAVAITLCAGGAGAGSLSGPVVDHGVGTVLRDVIRLPATSTSRPLARVGILREAPDGSGRLFVNDLRGPLYVIRDGVVSTYVDFADELPALDTGNLQLGVVSFALHPAFATNGLLYTAHTERPGAIQPNLVPALPAPVQYHAVITEWRAMDPAADVFSGTSRELMRIASPHATHNLGEIAFDPHPRPGDPDFGLLYIAAGDFGSAQRRQPDQLQRLDTVFGALLRIDPLGGPFTRDGMTYHYGLPAANPFALDGDVDTFGEIFAYGFRNPQNFHFDRERRGVLYLTDIGQGNLEEINLPFGGSNHGWPEREGTYALNVRINRESVFELPEDDESFGFTYPPVQYDHDEGLAIAGGLAVRGGPPSRLDGQFVFGDIVTGRLFYSDIDAMLAADDGSPATTAAVHELHLHRDSAETSLLDAIREELDDPAVNRTDLRFSTDGSGRLYVTTKQDGFVRELVPIPRLKGTVLYAPTAELSTVASCFGLLMHLGGSARVASVTHIDPPTQRSQRCHHVGGEPAGVDFALLPGSAYVVELIEPTELPSGSPPRCLATHLRPGVNLIGVAEPRIGLGCHDLLLAFGPGAVATVQRLDARDGRFRSCGFVEGVGPVGEDFPIRPGEGYTVHSREAVREVDLNDSALCD